MDYEFVRHTDTSENILNYSAFLSAPFVASSHFVDRARATEQYLRWQYFDNPVGHVIGYSAFYRGEMVGHFSTLPVIYSINGRVCRSLLALNLVTHPHHRGRGVFIGMAERTFEDASNEGYEYIAGVANQNSTHGLVNRLGFSLVAPLDIRIGFGNMTVDRGGDYMFRPVWNENSLKWRLANPSAKYFISNNNFVVAGTGRSGIMSQIRHLAPGEAKQINLPEACNRLRIWIGLAGRGNRNPALLRLPRFIRPVPLNFILKSLKGDNVIPGSREVLFELIDFDAY